MPLHTLGTLHMLPVLQNYLEVKGEAGFSTNTLGVRCHGDVVMCSSKSRFQSSKSQDPNGIVLKQSHCTACLCG